MIMNFLKLTGKSWQVIEGKQTI